VSYAARRARVLEALGSDGVLVLAAAPELRIGRDTDLRYVPDADLGYLTGCPEPDAVLVLRNAARGEAYTLFVRPRDAARELWTGPRGGVETAAEQYGADQAYSITELAERLPALVADAHTLYARPASGTATLDALTPRLLHDGRARRARHGKGVVVLAEPGLLLDELRLIKDAGEIEALRAAARVTTAAFREALATVREASGEAHVEAVIESAFRRRGASGPAFPTIVAGADNATVLHYIANAAPLQPGSLLLIDGGARVDGYCGDVSRTVPVSGSFDDRQRRVYDIVRGARDAAVAVARLGATIADVHSAASDVLLAGMQELGLVASDVDEAETLRQMKLYFPHRTSHWLGLDVHDPGDYVLDDAPRPLAEGMVFTIEPGLYVPTHSDAPQWLRGIGIRIEDDVLVTADGADVLTADLPVDAAAIESLMA
jgi:Xaa-Pro aminopeptidase